MAVWIQIVYFILFPIVCALCFIVGAHYNYKIFMSDERFEGYVKYHHGLMKMLKRSQDVHIIEDINFEGKEGKNVEGKKKNGGY